MTDMTRMRDTTALVLAGGLGTRLRDCVPDRPKVMAKVAGRPFLSHLLDHLVDGGIERVVLCTGYLGEMIEKKYSTHYRSLDITYSREEEPLGTGGAVLRAIDHVKTEQVLVLNGDSYCEADLSSFHHWCLAEAVKAALVAVEVADTARFGQVTLDGEFLVQAFEEKGRSSGPGLINAGVYFFKSEVVRAFGGTTPLSLEREVFPSLVGKELHGWQTTGRFIDIGTNESYAAARAFFEQEIQA